MWVLSVKDQLKDWRIVSDKEREMSDRQSINLNAWESGQRLNNFEENSGSKEEYDRKVWLGRCWVVAMNREAWKKECSRLVINYDVDDS